VDLSLQNDLAVIIDLHPTGEYKHQLAIDGNAAERFRLLWHNIAAQFQHSDAERVFFELLNEPEMGDGYRWAGIQATALSEVRSVAPKHTVIISGSRYSDIDNLLEVPAAADRNVIYNFHYYEPHIFTHQGASWGVPYWIELRKVPYPATAASLAATTAPMTDDVSRWGLLEYGLDHWDASRIAGEIAFAADWAKRRGVPLTCNEFGVYRDFSDPADRARWLHDVRTAFEQNHIGWTMWDYRGGFGVVTKDANGRSVPDVQTLTALGLQK
jgi:endoglucanase